MNWYRGFKREQAYRYSPDFKWILMFKDLPPWLRKDKQKLLLSNNQIIITMDLLGKNARDKITGFTGIITSKHIYITGCNQYGLQPKIDDKGAVPESRYFDENRLEIMADGHIEINNVQGEIPGGPEREHPNKA